jgi:hypothetical protein
VRDPIAHHRRFYDLVFHPRILDVVENLIGPNIQLQQTRLVLKRARRGPGSTGTRTFRRFPTRTSIWCRGRLPRRLDAGHRLPAGHSR